MIFDEDSGGLFGSVLGDEETGGLGEEASIVSFVRMDELFTYKTVAIWTREGQICKREGIRQAQFVLMEVVPRATAEARI